MTAHPLGAEGHCAFKPDGADSCVEPVAWRVEHFVENAGGDDVELTAEFDVCTDHLLGLLISLAAQGFEPLIVSTL